MQVIQQSSKPGGKAVGDVFLEAKGKRALRPPSEYRPQADREQQPTAGKRMLPDIANRQSEDRWLTQKGKRTFGMERHASHSHLENFRSALVGTSPPKRCLAS